MREGGWEDGLRGGRGAVSGFSYVPPCSFAQAAFAASVDNAQTTQEQLSSVVSGLPLSNPLPPCFMIVRVFLTLWSGIAVAMASIHHYHGIHTLLPCP